MVCYRKEERIEEIVSPQSRPALPHFKPCVNFNIDLFYKQTVIAIVYNIYHITVLYTTTIIVVVY